LHIGLQKTGTTTIQHYLNTYKNTLLDRGILSPVQGRSRFKHDRLFRELRNQEERSLFNWNKVITEIDCSNSEKVVISNEAFCLLTESQIKLI
jgi:hypothetical protein